MNDNSIPKSAMAIAAHPDDTEFTIAGTVALWAKAGCRVVYVICTDGNAGSHEPGMTRERLAEIRRGEERAAATILGVSEVVFLGHDDGQLQPDLELRRELVREIRKYKPEVVIASDPTSLFFGSDYINHPDHRAAGQAAVDAVAPACEMPLLWPEVGAPHRISQLYVHGNSEPNVWIDISTTVERKIKALCQHVSQLGDWDPAPMIRAWAAENGKEQEMTYAEMYRVINFG